MVVAAGRVTYALDERALRAAALGPNGPVARRLAREGAKIDATAKQLVSGPMLNVDTGRLRSSIAWKLFERANRIGVAVGAGVSYAVPLHEGGTQNVRAHTRRSPGGGSHTVATHTRYVTPRPFLAEAARRNGYPVR